MKISFGHLGKFYLFTPILVGILMAGGNNSPPLKPGFLSGNMHTEGTVTDIEGNSYRTVTIDGKEWMAENLKTKTYNDGSTIQSGLSDSEWKGTKMGALAIYPHQNVTGINSDDEMVSAYGIIYNWYAIQDNKLCPEGWRVPADQEWAELREHIALSTGSDPGNHMKSKLRQPSPSDGRPVPARHPRWDHHRTQHGTDKFGFAALPAGNRSSSGSYSNIGSHGNWWTSTEGPAIYAWSWRIAFDSGDIFKFLNNKTCGFSVRCIKVSE